jgi:hypothetical protein
MHDGDHVSAGREAQWPSKADSDGISDGSFEFVHRRSKNRRKVKPSAFPPLAERFFKN